MLGEPFSQSHFQGNKNIVEFNITDQQISTTVIMLQNKDTLLLLPLLSLTA